MANKNKVIEELKDKNYALSEVKHLIGTITHIDDNSPSILKKADVFISAVGTKRRPVVIIKVTDCLVYGIPLSTTEDCLNLCTFKSRFFGEGYFSNQLVTAPLEYAKINFVGVLDNSRDLKIAVEKLKIIVKNL